MRLIVFFDLPAVTHQEKLTASRFRRFLIKRGFGMLQCSVYIRVTRSSSDSEKYIRIVNSNCPKEGDIRCLTISETQYAMILRPSETEDFGTNDLIEI